MFCGTACSSHCIYRKKPCSFNGTEQRCKLLTALICFANMWAQAQIYIEQHTLCVCVCVYVLAFTASGSELLSISSSKFGERVRSFQFVKAETSALAPFCCSSYMCIHELQGTLLTSADTFSVCVCPCRFLESCFQPSIRVWIITIQRHIMGCWTCA